MSQNREELFSDDLQGVADVLRNQRPRLDPLMLEQIKRTAISDSRQSPSRNKGSFMRQRLTTAIAVGFLAIGAGGTMALAGGNGEGSSGGSASFHQYRPPCEHGKGRGEDHECHGHEGEHGRGNGDGGGGDHGHGHHGHDG
jgi:hypothetical protein